MFSSIPVREIRKTSLSAMLSLRRPIPKTLLRERIPEPPTLSLLPEAPYPCADTLISATRGTLSLRRQAYLCYPRPTLSLRRRAHGSHIRAPLKRCPMSNFDMCTLAPQIVRLPTPTDTPRHVLVSKFHTPQYLATKGKCQYSVLHKKACR